MIPYKSSDLYHSPALNPERINQAGLVNEKMIKSPLVFVNLFVNCRRSLVEYPRGESNNDFGVGENQINCIELREMKRYKVASGN
jgi:hypothetical protein